MSLKSNSEISDPPKRGRPKFTPDYGAGLHLRLKRGERAIIEPTDTAGVFHTVWQETHLVDSLYARGVLGIDEKRLPTEDANRRKQAAEEMRMLFQRAGMEHKSSPMDGVPVQQSGVPKDIAWSTAKAYRKYNRLMRDLGPAHSNSMQEICCYDRLPRGWSIWALLNGLDTLAEKLGI